jgi:hypothetical protein
MMVGFLIDKNQEGEAFKQFHFLDFNIRKIKGINLFNYSTFIIMPFSRERKRSINTENPLL